MRRKILITGVGALAILALGGCGASSSQPTGQTISLTRAAYVSGSAKGSRVLMTMQETIPGVGQVNMTGNGSFSTTPRAGSMAMRMSLPSAAAAQAGLGTLRMQMVIVPGTLYMKLPPQITSKIPGGKPWWKIDLAKVGKLAGVPGLSTLMSGTSSLNDPGQYLDFLRATSSGSVENLGSATVNGVQTTHYRAKIDLAKLPNAVQPSARPAVEQLVATLRKKGMTPQGFPVDAWIDSSNLIRRIEMAYSQPVSAGQAVNVSMKVDYVDYGSQPRPVVPASGQTVDLLALLGRG
jgi:hypothetical protein